MAQVSTVQAQSQVRFNRFLALVYLMMAVGMVVTALVATTVSSNKDLMLRTVTDPWFAFGLFIIQIVLVVALSAAVLRLSSAAAFLIFIVYSALTGLTISTIFIYYSQTVIAYTFWLAAGMFLFSSIVGFFIKGDLSALGRFLFLALLGYLFGWFFVWLFPSSGLSQAWNFTGIILFAGLTVWDTNRLRAISTQMEGQKGMGSIAVLGALTLYLDFINLFLLLLRTSRR
jgi:FtsH-binding integral membrane protein